MAVALNSPYSLLPAAVQLGTVSYCAYLTQLTINMLAYRILLHAQPQIYNAAGIGVSLLATLLTLALATLSWRYLEKPLLRRGRSYLYEDKGSRFELGPIRQPRN